MRYERVATLAAMATVAVWASTCKAGDGPPPPPPPPPAPMADVGVDLRATTGRAVSLTARVAPPGADPSSYRWTLAWGDASVDSGDVGAMGLITVSHTYAAVGHYAVTLTGRASSGTTANDTATAVVEAPGTPQVFIGAGDIGECGLSWAAKTAAVIDTTPGTVFTLGDNAYPSGQDVDYTNCYEPTWGRFKKRTHPAPGNHEYALKDTTAAGYFGYYGVAAGPRPIGNYSYDLGGWHIIVLNSSFLESQALSRALSVDTQLAWLSADLAAHPATCTLAMWHHPHFSSGPTHGANPEETGPTKPFWDTLYAHGADVILSGHEHNYERFAPQTSDGTADPARGIREFVVGTGGGGYDPLDTTKVKSGNSEAGSVDHGVLKLTLMDGSYHWEFIPVGYSLPLDSTPSQYSHTDSGTASCH
jgi:acid phosphatase type 7